MYLEGKKTFIRTLVKKDLPLLVKWKNDPIIAEMVSGNPVMTTLDMEERRFERSLEEFNTIRLIIEKEDKSPIGFISVCEIDKYNKKLELGLLIGEKQYWSNGYATDAMETIISYLLYKLGFNRIGVEVFKYNERAIRLYQNLGFEVEGIQRSGLFRDGRYEDILLMGLLKKDYQARRVKTKNTTTKNCGV